MEIYRLPQQCLFSRHINVGMIDKAFLVREEPKMVLIRLEVQSAQSAAAAMVHRGLYFVDEKSKWITTNLDKEGWDHIWQSKGTYITNSNRLEVLLLTGTPVTDFM